MLISGAIGQLEIAISEPSVDKPSALGLICHPHPLHEGSMNNKVVTTVAKTFNQLDAVAVRFNYRGVGQSEGKYGEGIGEIDDAHAVLEYVRQEYPELPLWIAGFSFGGYIAANLAKQCQADLLVCIGPAVETFDFTELVEFPCPTIVVQGEQDEIVPPDKVYAWVETVMTQKQLIRMPETSHFFHRKLIHLRDLLATQISLMLTSVN